jgi:hypothetical protein
VVERTRAAIEAAQLPNLEDPDDLLSPERFVPEDPWCWPGQPLPASLGWLDYGCFPRIAWLGMVLDCELPSDRSQVGEIRLGYAGPELFEESREAAPRIDFAGINGASLGLRVPHVQPGARIELVNLSPRARALELQLPSEAPRIRVDGRKGKLLETEPVIHSLIIEPDRGRLSVVWRGAAPALRSYLPAELPQMPFSVSW